MTDVSHDPQQDTIRARMEAMIAAMRRPKARSAAASDDPQRLAAVAAPGPERSVAEPSREANATAILDGGVRIGRYMILRVLGAGGMGVVYAAYDPELDRRIALKLVRPGMAGEHERARLLREAMALAKLSHPNVVAIHDVGTAGEQVWLAMELVRGRTLRQWQSERPRSWRSCLAVYVQAGEALAAAHAAGLVHRDFKPDNCIVDPSGRLRVLDFGLAGGAPARPSRETEDDEGVELEHPHDDLTAPGTIMGTPGYMSPEQWAGETADARSDQFSFCVSLYEAVYGERPFEGGSVAASRRSMQRGVVRPAPKKAVPAALRKVVLRGLAIDPEQRWPSMAELLEQLRRLVTPRGRRWMALGLGLAGVGVATGQYVEVARRCEGARAQLEGVWDDARRQQVQHSILDTKLSYAPDTWERVEQRLDDYAEAWASKHTEVCEATSVRQEQSAEVMDLRMGCLRHRRAKLRATVEVFARADARVVDEAVRMTVSLPGLAGCDDVERLEQQQRKNPPPEDPAVAQEVEVLRERLADVEAEQAAGRYTRALELAEPIASRAEVLGYMPFMAEVLVRRGRIYRDEGRYAESEQELRRAHALALEHDSDILAYHAASSLAFVVGDRQQRTAEGLLWGGIALPLAERSDEPIHRVVSLEALGNVLRAAGLYEDAEARYRQALQEWEELGGTDDPRAASTVGNLGAILRDLGRYAEAESQFRRALHILEQNLGPDHPRGLLMMTNLGSALTDQGKYEEAERLQRRVLDKSLRVLGTDHPLVATAMGNLGVVLYEQGRYEEAEAQQRRAIALQERVLGPEHPELANSLVGLGGALEQQGRYAESIRIQTRALQIRERLLGEDHPAVALVLNNLGILINRQGQHEDAEHLHRRALRIRESALDEDHPDVAMSMTNLGIALTDQGKYEEAVELHRRALQIRRNALGPDHPSVAMDMSCLGSALEQQGHREEAAERFEQALRIREQALGADHADLTSPLVGLARVALAQRRTADARAYAERALSVGDDQPALVGELAAAQFVLARVHWHERAEREFAYALAEHARDGYAQAGERWRDERDEVERWLAEHTPR